jgi:hypothetical protein
LPKELKEVDLEEQAALEDREEMAAAADHDRKARVDHRVARGKREEWAVDPEAAEDSISRTSWIAFR